MLTGDSRFFARRRWPGRDPRAGGAGAWGEGYAGGGRWTRRTSGASTAGWQARDGRGRAVGDWGLLGCGRLSDRADQDPADAALANVSAYQAAPMHLAAGTQYGSRRRRYE